MKEFHRQLHQNLNGAEYMADILDTTVPFLKKVSKESGGLGYVIGRWELPWLDPSSSKNKWLVIHTKRIASRINLPVFSDLDLFDHPDVKNLMVEQDRMGETIGEVRNILLTFGGITRMYALWGWGTSHGLTAALGVAHERDIDIYDFPKKVDDPLLQPLPEELK